MGIQDVLRNHPAVGGLVGGAVLGAGSFGIINIIRGAAKKDYTEENSDEKKGYYKEKSWKENYETSSELISKKES